jgi:hypothetical protein
LLAAALHLTSRLLVVDAVLALRRSLDSEGPSGQSGPRGGLVNWWWIGSESRLRLQAAACHHALSSSRATSEAACALLLVLIATTHQISPLSIGECASNASDVNASPPAWCNSWHRLVVEEITAGMLTVRDIPPNAPGPFALLLLAATVEQAATLSWVRLMFGDLHCAGDEEGGSSKLVLALMCSFSELPKATMTSEVMCYLHLFRCLESGRLLGSEARSYFSSYTPSDRNISTTSWISVENSLAVPEALDWACGQPLEATFFSSSLPTVIHPLQLDTKDVARSLLSAIAGGSS